VNVVSSINRVIPRLSSKDQEQTLIGSHQSGSGAFVVKNFNATLFSELVRKWGQFGQFCIEFRAVTERSDTPQNMSFGSNGVDLVRSLRNMPTQLHLATLCVNGTGSARLPSTFVQ
jgi:hypothetical protein